MRIHWALWERHWILYFKGKIGKGLAMSEMKILLWKFFYFKIVQLKSFKPLHQRSSLKNLNELDRINSISKPLSFDLFGFEMIRIRNPIEERPKFWFRNLWSRTNQVKFIVITRWRLQKPIADYVQKFGYFGMRLHTASCPNVERTWKEHGENCSLHCSLQCRVCRRVDVPILNAQTTWSYLYSALSIWRSL